jgi:hypothetical protein
MGGSFYFRFCANLLAFCGGGGGFFLWWWWWFLCVRFLPLFFAVILCRFFFRSFVRVKVERNLCPNI